MSGSGALVAGAIAAAPIVIALAGDQAVMAIAEMGPSGSPELLTTLRNAIRARAGLLHLNLHNDDYWWSTRVYLVAALAMDYTKVEQLLFVRGQEERVWIGMIDPPAARDLLAQKFPEYERYYREVRNLAAAAAEVSAPLDRDAEIEKILTNWPGKFRPNEAQAKQIVTADLARQWLGANLDTEALPHGPLTQLLRYQVNLRPRRYTALTADGRLIEVISAK